MDKGYKYKLERLDDSKIKVTATVEKSLIDTTQEQVYQDMAKDVKMPGFRAGKAPRAQIEAKIANDVFSQTIRAVISSVAADIVDEEKLNPLTQLQYDLGKASDTELEFTFEFTNYPEVKLTDLSKLEFEKTDTNVEDAEIDEVIISLFKNREAAGEKADAQKVDIKIDDITVEMVKSLELPEIETTEKLREHVSERLTQIKQQSQDSAALEKLIEQAIEKSNIPAPDALVHEIAHRQIDEYIERIKNLKTVDVEEFLKAQGKSMESLGKEKHDQARKQIQRELLLTEIVREHKLMPTAEDIDQELSTIGEGELKAQYDNPDGRRYIMSMLIQQRAIQQLQKLAKEVKAKPEKPAKQADKKSA